MRTCFFKSSQLGSVLFKGQKCIVCHMIKVPVPQEFLQHIIYGKKRLSKAGCQISLGLRSAVIRTESTGSNFTSSPCPPPPPCLLHNFSDFAFSFSHTAGRRQPPSILLLPFPAWPLPPPRAWGLLEGCWGAVLPLGAWDNLQ